VIISAATGEGSQRRNIMIFSVVLVGLLASAALAERNLKPYRFAPGQTYLYDYSARLQTGIPKISDQFSSFKIQADVLIQARSANSDEVKLWLSNVRAGKVDGASRTEDVTEMHEWSKEYQDELVKPIVFTHRNGQVVSFRAARSEPEWSINIKKSILSLFNLNLQPKQILRSNEGNLVPKPVPQEDLTYFGVLEQGMGGECETTYELNQIPSEESESEEFLLNVTKTRNYQNCNSRPVLVKDNFSLQHQERHEEDSQSVVKGYYPVPSVNKRQEREKDMNKWQKDASIKQYNNVKYNISLSQSVAVIEGIFSEGRVVYNTFGDKIVAITTQNLTLKKQEESKTVVSIESLIASNFVKYDDLSFKLPKMALSGSQSQQEQKMRMDIPHMALFGQQKTSELLRKMPQYFRTLAREILASETSPESKDVMQRVIEIVNTFASLPREALDQMFKQIAEPGQDERSPAEAQLTRKLFLDCLALSGTNDAALLIKQKIISQKVTSNEARELLEALPHNMFLPDVRTIDAFLELYQHPLVVSRPIVHTAAAVCFGKLVHIGHKKSEAIWSVEKYQKSQNAATQEDESPSSSEWDDLFPQKKVTDEDIERYVVVTGRLLEQADSFQKKVAAIEALAHMGVPQALKNLKPYITGDAPLTVVPGYEVEEGQSVLKERDYLRTVAIYAVAHIAHRFPKQVQPLILPVFRNSAEPHQMRLAAFTVLMLCQPEPHILESIAADLHRESDPHVVSFVASALKSVGSFKTPCERKLARAANDAIDSVPKIKLTQKSSRFFARDYFDTKKSFGLMGISELVQSRRSPIPKAGYLSLIETTGQFHEQLLEIGFNAKGLEKIVHRIVGRNGVIAALVQNKQSEKPQKRTMVPIEEAARTFRDRISSTLGNKNLKDSARLDVFFKLFERTSIYALDEAALFDLIEDVESAIDSWAKDYANGYTGTYAKVFMPSSIMKVVPSELGLPVVVSHKNPLILSMKVRNAKLDRRNGFQVSGELEPKLMHSSYTFLFGVVPVHKTAVGTHVEKTTQASLPLKIRVAYKEQNNKWSVNITPKPKHEVFFHKSEAKTFVSRVHTATTPSREWLETAQSIRNPETSNAKMEKRLTYKNLPVAAQISLETEEKLQDPKVLEKKIQKNGLIPTVIEIFQNPGLNAREVHVNLESEQNESAFDYEWDMEKQMEEEPERKEDDSSDDYYFDSSEESHEEEQTDDLVGQIFARVNNAITGQAIDQADITKFRQNAAQWMRKTKQNMKWTENYNDYESEDESWDERVLRRNQQPKARQNSCQQMKTLYVREKGRICFTTRPVLSCATSCQPESVKQVNMDFHCLPMSSAFTMQLVKETEKNVLWQLANKRVDFTRTVSAPLSCSA
jgi:hypothetical protein